MARESWNLRESLLDDFEHHQADVERVGKSAWPGVLVGVAIGSIWFGHFTWVRLALLLAAVALLVVVGVKEARYPKEIRIRARRMLDAQVAETTTAEARVAELQAQLRMARGDE